MENIILLTESQKVPSYKQFPPNTEYVYSYLEARGHEFPEVVFFGLQYTIKKYLEGQVVTQEKLDEAESIYLQHFNRTDLFNKSHWQYIIDNHNGHLPIKIKAVPEGTVVPVRNVLLTIENTDPKCYWLVNHLESLLCQIWYASTVATRSREMKMLFLNYLEKTGNVLDIDSKVIDLGFRSSTSVESAAIGGAAHLINFKTTTNLSAIRFVKQYYPTEDFPGHSFPLVEHNPMMPWGAKDEINSIKHMLNTFPDGLLSIVADTFDQHALIQAHFKNNAHLRNQMTARDGILFIQPDSGNPVETAVHTVAFLGQIFNPIKNEKGFFTIHPKIKVFAANGFDYKSIRDTLKELDNKKYSADCINFGVGGGLLQKLNRETLDFVFKCSSVTINGEPKSVNKTAGELKTSKAGKLKLVKNDKDKIVTVAPFQDGDDLLTDVFCDGKLLYESKFDDIIERAFVD